MSDVPVLAVMRPVNEQFANVVDYRTYRPIEKVSRYDSEIENRSNKIIKKAAMQIID